MKPKPKRLNIVLAVIFAAMGAMTAFSAAHANQPPVLGPIGDYVVNEGQRLTFSLSSADPDGDGLTYTAANLPAGATFDPATATFSWTPAYTQAGIYELTFAATDPGTLTDSQAIVIAVFDVNRPPVLEPIGDFALEEGQGVAFMVTAIDPDGDEVTCSVLNLPVGAAFDPRDAAFTWMPEHGQAGTYEVTFTASDDGAPPLAASQTVTIRVNGRTVLAANGPRLP